MSLYAWHLLICAIVFSVVVIALLAYTLGYRDGGSEAGYKRKIVEAPRRRSMGDSDKPVPGYVRLSARGQHDH